MYLCVSQFNTLCLKRLDFILIIGSLYDKHESSELFIKLLKFCVFSYSGTIWFIKTSYKKLGFNGTE